jgi:hypothetical protein
MAGVGTLIVVIGAVVGAVWLLARRAAWADAHPPLAPIEVFGDFPNVERIASPGADERRP